MSRRHRRQASLATFPTFNVDSDDAVKAPPTVSFSPQAVDVISSSRANTNMQAPLSTSNAGHVGDQMGSAAHNMPPTKSSACRSGSAHN